MNEYWGIFPQIFQLFPQHAAEHWDVGITKHVHDQAEGTQHTDGLKGAVGHVAEGLQHG